jgi:CHAT domain-containing protein
MELARRLPIPGRHDVSDTVDELIRRLPPDDTFVEYLFHRGDLVIFHARAGRLRVHRREGRAAVVEELLDSVQFHLDAQTWLGGQAGPSHHAALEDRLSRLSDLLFEAIPLSGIERLWIAPHAGLVQVPWAALPVCAGQHLVDRLQLTLLPGAEAAALLLRGPARRPRTVALGGAPSSTLPMVEREISDLATLAPSATVAATTTRDEFLTLLETHELVHLAGHAVFLDGLPFASGLKMSDGYVTVRDLAATRLAARFVSFGVCSGLRLGREHGDRHAGFVLALLSGGVRTVVGPISPVRDEVAHAFDLALHTTLSETANPCHAFSCAVRTVRELDPQPAVWGAFHMYGDPRPWES